MDRLAAMQMFTRVVETGSFSAVAKELNTTQPTVSKRVAELEQWLGAKLLNRSTRSLRLTEVGADYYERCITILQDVEDAEQNVGLAQTQPKGKLRISTVVSFGRLFVMRYLPDFLEMYPDIKVEITLSDRVIDMVEEGVDLAFRMGNLADSTLTAKRICKSPLVTVATPGYLEKRGEPQHPADLKQHEYVIFSDLEKPQQIEFKENGELIYVNADSKVHTNSSEAMRAALLAGLGINRAPLWLVGDKIQSGELVSILKDFSPGNLDIYAVYPSGRNLPSKARAFIDFFSERFTEDYLITGKRGN